MRNAKDIGEKLLEEKNDVFADIVNVLLFNGRQVVKPDDLESAPLRSQFKAAGGTHQQERDVAKYWLEGKIRIAMYGIENETQPVPYMPFRLFSYEGSSYKEQVIRYEQNKNASKKTQPFYPVITLVLYFGKSHWNYPKTLLGCLGESVSEELRPFVNDYKAHVFEISHLAPEQVKMFKSDFRIIADYCVQTAHNDEYIPSTDEITHIEEVFKLMFALTGDYRFEDTFNEEHWQKGELITMIDLFDKYENRGIEKGRESALLASLKSIMKKFGLTVEQAMDALEIPTEERIKLQVQL